MTNRSGTSDLLLTDLTEPASALRAPSPPLQVTIGHQRSIPDHSAAQETAGEDSTSQRVLITPADLSPEVRAAVAPRYAAVDNGRVHIEAETIALRSPDGRASAGLLVPQQPVEVEMADGSMIVRDEYGWWAV